MGHARILNVAWVVLLTSAGAGLAAPAQKPDTITFASHRAIYDLKLASARGNRPVEAVRGRILYDFSGNECEGYALQFRQVSEIDAGEGVRMTTDMRATTWEDAAANAFRFNSQNYVDQKLKSSVDGRAERENAQVGVKLEKPEKKAFEITAQIIFPTDHMRRIILAAREGKTLLQGPVFDGSDNGQKVYDTLTVIGQPIEPSAAQPDDAAGKDEHLSKLRRWPVSISYFDKSKTEGDQLPVYGIKFELYENGVSRALALDYNDFVVSGTMTALETRPTKPCQ
ncbi:cell envelope integrity EipB family protein [Pseudorhodoplanes sp.]|uniref:cell envelope integrity EipB family protein n=1 Tax=Pseudorhodoplanes sp. TaxID=1934341 RepID=UPI002C0A6C3B|nr:cell envelope integrity EipB family protein [Pseudorhodoplanes sp.]HWV43705.1 cell envelope integrity EipB family protein [Pseudorhodoplanes sp.]